MLESIRLRDSNSRIIFAGSSEEYGLQFDSERHLENMKKKYGINEPLPREIPEMPHRRTRTNASNEPVCYK